MNIKIGETIISNVNITDSGDLLGLNFVSSLSLGALEALFTPGSYPTFQLINEAGEVVGVYKNRKQLTLRVDAKDTGNEVNIALHVVKTEKDEVEALTAQVEQAAAELSENTVALAELGNMAAEQEVRSSETDVALAELGILYAELLERVTVLEEAQASNEVVDETVTEEAVTEEPAVEETPVEETVTEEPTVEEEVAE